VDDGRKTGGNRIRLSTKGALAEAFSGRVRTGGSGLIGFCGLLVRASTGGLREPLGPSGLSQEGEHLNYRNLAG
jgi:hypothetical protein